MLKRLPILMALALFSPAVVAQQVTVEYNEDIKPGSYKTFTFVDAQANSMSEANPAMHERAVANIRVMMVRSGIREVASGAELHVTYYAARGDDLSVQVSDYGYKYPRSYKRSGSGGSAMPATYTQGSIIVDVWDTETDEVVWRGVAIDILKANPEKRGKQLDKVMETMWRKWAAIKRKLLARN